MRYLGSFYARMWNHKHYFYFETATGEIFCEKEEFVCCICRFRESFFLSLVGCYMMGFEETRNRRVVGSSCTIDVQKCLRSFQSQWFTLELDSASPLLFITVLKALIREIRKQIFRNINMFDPKNCFQYKAEVFI